MKMGGKLIIMRSISLFLKLSLTKIYYKFGRWGKNNRVVFKIENDQYWSAVDISSTYVGYKQLV